MTPIPFRLAVVGLFLLISPMASAQNWSSWRGPNGDGTSLEKNLPVAWSAQNIAWKSPVAGEGFSSPVIWADRIFLTTALLDTQDRLLLCYNKKDGRLLDRKSVV